MVNDEKIVFDGVHIEDSSETVELDVFGKSNFIKVPEVGESITIEVKAIQEDKSPMRKSKEGKEFHTGFKDKTGEIISYDIITTTEDRFNLKSAMLYYGVGAALKEYAKTHPGLKPSYLGAKLKISHLYDGSHANMKLSDLQKIKGFATIEETTNYQNDVKKAMKEFKIYEVKLVN